ncbi:MAG: LPS export ABC transporter periplasmic protein LptC [Candidatus Latescibacteria bacterium]|nr:LPS export ABC transporter periplasmic protein LptC [Candidatus Latescibacterota bacterium]
MKSGRASPVSYSFGVCLSLFLATGCSPPSQPPSNHSAVPKPPDQEAWGWNTVVTRNGRKRAEVTAGHFRKFDRTLTALLDSGVTVSFYDGSGLNRVSVLTARQAEIHEDSGDMVVTGGVAVVATNGTRLETDTLRWNRETDMIKGNGRMTLRRPDGEETGEGFEASSDLKWWKMRQVSTRLGGVDSLR